MLLLVQRCRWIGHVSFSISTAVLKRLVFKKCSRLMRVKEWGLDIETYLWILFEGFGRQRLVSGAFLNNLIGALPSIRAKLFFLFCLMFFISQWQCLDYVSFSCTTCFIPLNLSKPFFLVFIASRFLLVIFSWHLALLQVELRMTTVLPCNY